MEEDIIIVVERKYKTSFTPEGEKEPDKMCWNCKILKPATKYGFKYEVRDGVKGKVRTSSCLACKDGAEKPTDSLLQKNNKELEDKINDLENKNKELEDRIKELFDLSKKMQLLLFDVQGSIAILKMESK